MDYGPALFVAVPVYQPAALPLVVVLYQYVAGMGRLDQRGGVGGQGNDNRTASALAGCVP